MRFIVLCSFSVLAAGCQGLTGPTHPSAVGSTLSPSSSATGTTQAQGGAELPFRGSFAGTSAATADCPPACPPTTLTITATSTGEATHLGRFTLTAVELVSLATKSGTGTYTFTAANGDQLFTTTVGGEDGFTEPNISRVTQAATVNGGTGRFAGATGTFTIRMTQTIDFATNTAALSGTLDGQISVSH